MNYSQVAGTGYYEESRYLSKMEYVNTDCSSASQDKKPNTSYASRSQGMIKILLVDSQRRVREGLRMRMALEPDLTVIGEAGDGQSALAMTQELHPDVIVMDIEIPNQDGIALSQAMRQLVPESEVIVLSLHDDPLTKARAHEAGVAAFVEKRGGALPLLTAIRMAANKQG
jgi:DNA-binding NarL/FixJ family response regulator